MLVTWCVCHNIPRQLLLALAHWLCEHYDSDHRARSLVNHVHLHLMPTMNPDGFAMRTRNNRNDIDLNRDFPDPIQHLAAVWPGGLGTEQPETRAVMNWTLEVGFAASASLHEVSGCVWYCRLRACFKKNESSSRCTPVAPTRVRW